MDKYAVTLHTRVVVRATSQEHAEAAADIVRQRTLAATADGCLVAAARSDVRTVKPAPVGVPPFRDPDTYLHG